MEEDWAASAASASSAAAEMLVDYAQSNDGGYEPRMNGDTDHATGCDSAGPAANVTAFLPGRIKGAWYPSHVGRGAAEIVVGPEKPGMTSRNDIHCQQTNGTAMGNHMGNAQAADPGVSATVEDAVLGSAAAECWDGVDGEAGASASVDSGMTSSGQGLSTGLPGRRGVGSHLLGADGNPAGQPCVAGHPRVTAEELAVIAGLETGPSTGNTSETSASVSIPPPHPHHHHPGDPGGEGVGHSAAVGPPDASQEKVGGPAKTAHELLVRSAEDSPRHTAASDAHDCDLKAGTPGTDTLVEAADSCRWTESAGGSVGIAGSRQPFFGDETPLPGERSTSEALPPTPHPATVRTELTPGFSVSPVSVGGSSVGTTDPHPQRGLPPTPAAAPSSITQPPQSCATTHAHRQPRRKPPRRTPGMEDTYSSEEEFEDCFEDLNVSSGEVDFPLPGLTDEQRSATDKTTISLKVATLAEENNNSTAGTEPSAAPSAPDNADLDEYMIIDESNIDELLKPDLSPILKEVASEKSGGDTSGVDIQAVLTPSPDHSIGGSAEGHSQDVPPGGDIEDPEGLTLCSPSQDAASSTDAAADGMEQPLEAAGDAAGGCDGVMDVTPHHPGADDAAAAADAAGAEFGWTCENGSASASSSDKGTTAAEPEDPHGARPSAAGENMKLNHAEQEPGNTLAINESNSKSIGYDAPGDGVNDKSQGLDPALGATKDSVVPSETCDSNAVRDSNDVSLSETASDHPAESTIDGVSEDERSRHVGSGDTAGESARETLTGTNFEENDKECSPDVPETGGVSDVDGMNATSLSTEQTGRDLENIALECHRDLATSSEQPVANNSDCSQSNDGVNALTKPDSERVADDAVKADDQPVERDAGPGAGVVSVSAGDDTVISTDDDSRENKVEPGDRTDSDLTKNTPASDENKCDHNETHARDAEHNDGAVDGVPGMGAITKAAGSNEDTNDVKLVAKDVPELEAGARDVIAVNDAVAKDAVPVNDVVAKDTVPVNDAVAKDVVPAEETVTMDSVPAEETVAKDAVTVEETVTKDAVTAEETVTKDVVPAEETVTKDAVPAEETVTNEAVTAEETVTKDAVTAEETVTKEAVTAEETVAQDAVPAEESVTKDAVTAEETVTKDAVTPEETVTKDVVPAEETVAKDAVTAEETVAKDAVTAEETVTKDAVLAEETVTKDAVIAEETVTKDAVPAEDTVTNEAVTAEDTVTKEAVTAEETVTKDAVTAEETVTKDAVPAEETVTKDAVTPEETVTKDVVPAEETVAKDAVTAEETVTKDAVTAEETVTKDAVPAEETVIKDVVPTEQTVTKDTVPTEQTVTKDTVPAEETVTRDVVPAEETVTKDAVPAEETVTKDAVTAEETVAKDAVTAEETVAKDAGRAEEAVAKDAVTAEETVTKDVMPAEETVTKDVMPAEETVAKEAVTAEETVTKDAVPAEETVIKDVVTAEETVTRDVMPAEETVTKDAVTAEETVAKDAGRAEEAFAKDAVTAEETVTKDAMPAEETVTKDAVTPEETVTKDAVTPEETVAKDAVTAEETVTKDAVPAEENVTNDAVSAEETVAKDAVTAEKTVAKEAVTAEETVAKEAVTAEETVTKEAVTAEETVTKEAVTAEETVTKDAVTSEETVAKDAVTAEETVAKEAVTAEETVTKDAVLAEETVTKDAVIAEETVTKDAVPAEDTVTNEAVTAEDTVTKEAVTAEETVTKDAVTAEETITKDAVPAEETVTKDVVPAEETVAKDAVTAEETVTKDAVTAEETVTKDAVPAEETVTKDVVPAQKTVAKEAVTAEETVTKDAVTAEETVTKDAVPAEETVAKGAVPAEETVAKDAVTAEETVTKDAVPAEETVTKDAVPAEETVTKDAVTAEETVIKDAVPAEETVTKDAVTAEETVAKGAVPVEETVAKDAVTAEETVTKDAVPAEETVTKDAVTAEETVTKDAVTAEETVTKDAVTAEETVAKDAESDSKDIESTKDTFDRELMSPHAAAKEGKTSEDIVGSQDLAPSSGDEASVAAEDIPRGTYDLTSLEGGGEDINPFITKSKIPNDPADGAERVILPKGAYNLDFLDDTCPDFNPFETKCRVSSSPPRSSPLRDAVAGEEAQQPSESLQMKPSVDVTFQSPDNKPAKVHTPSKLVENESRENQENCPKDDAVVATAAVVTKPDPASEGDDLLGLVDSFANTLHIEQSTSNPTEATVAPSAGDSISTDEKENVSAEKPDPSESTPAPGIADTSDPEIVIGKGPGSLEAATEEVLGSAPEDDKQFPATTAEVTDASAPAEVAAPEPQPVAVEPTDSAAVSATNEPTAMDDNVEDAIPIPKGTYNFNFDDLDENVNPFTSGCKMGMSPPKNGISIDNAAIDPFQTRNKMANTPPVSMDKEQNPFQTLNKMGQSPPPSSKAPLDEEQNPFETKSKMPSSPPASPKVPKDTEETPFQTKSKVALSPPSSPKIPKGDQESPFQTKNKMAATPPGSPKVSKKEEDPFKTKSKVAGTPPGSPKLADMEDPFATKSMVAMTPPTSSQEENPFATKSKVAMTPPTSSQEENPFATKSKVAMTPPTSSQEENPFATKSKVAMTPPASSMEENPFATKSKVAMTPPASAVEENPFATKSKVAMTPPASSMEENPFATKSKVALSPPGSPKFSRVEEENPFQTKTKMAATPPGSPKAARVADPPPPADEPANETPAAEETEAPPVKKVVKKKGAAKKPISKRPKFRPPNLPKTDGDEEIKIFMPGEKPASAAAPAPAPAEDDIQIFAPPPPPSSVTMDTTSEQSMSQDSAMSVSQSSSEAANPSDLDPPPPAPMEFAALDEGLGDEDFQPASEVFNDPAAWEMLDKYGGDADATTSLLGRQSLYVKFDPLVQAANTPPKQNPKVTLKHPGIDTITESEDDLMVMNTPPATARTQAKHPAARALESIAAQDVGNTDLKSSEIDRLLLENSPQAMSSQQKTPPRASEPLCGGDNANSDIVQVLKFSQSDVNRMRKEYELEVQAQMLQKEREWNTSRQAAQTQWEGKYSTLIEENKKLKTSHEQMQTIVEEFEKTMTQVIAEKETSKESVTDVIKERDQALEDLQSVEAAFSDLHRRYEKVKTTVEGFKKNEETLKKCMVDYQSKIKAQEQKYGTLKQHAEERLEHANAEIEKVRKAHQSEVMRLTQALRKSELQVQGLEQTVDQKTKENQELTSICDELLKVSK